MVRHWFKCHGECISRLPDVEGDTPKRRRFKRYHVGFFLICHIPEGSMAAF